MSKFNIIKKSRKKSEDIDEKIEYLDRELDKNGLREGMVTSKIYQGSTRVPNQDVSDFVALSQGGYGLGLSAADGNHLGNATLGPVSGSTGVALAPPHPVSGVRRSARHITSGLGDSTPLRPGQTTTIGFSDNPPTRTMGSALWFYDPNYNSGEGQWDNLEYGVQQGAWGFWDTIKTGQFAGIYTFNTNLSQHPSGDISNKISGINFGTNGAIGEPETVVLTQNDLGDPGFLPIDIPLSKQGFDYLLGKTGQYDPDADDDFRNLPPEELANIFSDPESEEAQEAAVNIVSNEIKEKPELASKFEQFGKAGETFFRYLTGTLPETIDNEYLGEEYVNSMIADAEPFFGDGVGNKLVFGDNILGTTQEPIRQGNTITVDFNYDFKTNAEELKGKEDQLNFMQRTFGEILANAFGTYSIDGSPKAFGPVLGGFGNLLDLVAGGFFSKFIETGKALGGAQHRPGKLTMDLSQIASENPKLLNHLFNQGLITYEELKTLREGGQLPEYDPTSEENFEYNKPSWFTFSYRTDDGRIFGYNFSGAFGELKLGPGGGERGSMESGYGTKGYDFRSNSGGTSWTMDYDGTSMWDKPGTNKPKSDPKPDPKPKPKPYKPTPQGGRGGGQGNPTNRRGSGVPKEDVHYKSEGELLFESTGLGHFDPEVLNVDINDIRKGIMPEFPKDPPPDMINGYSAKSKLAPKTIEGEPFIKITKKDLAKNHRLKDSEIKDFMKQIDAINNYIKQNPAELKYAMIRYPKDDPRLAQLNFKLDQMREASDEYMETHFPENESLFKKIQNKIKDNIEKTDPRRIDTSVPLVSEEEARIAKERRLNVLERYKKQVDVKPFFNKKTPEIDWKIDYLNKELEKNGLDEAAMRTSMIYQGAKEIPNADYVNFTGGLVNGLGLGFSGSDGNGAGDAYVGEITADMRLGHAYTGQKGVAISPPHPVTGQRRYATTQVGFAGVFAPLRPGTQQRGFPNTDYVSGGALWYWNPYHNNGEGQPPGLWYNLEFATRNDGTPGQWTFWDTNFLGFFTMNPNLDQIDFAGANIGTQISTIIQNAKLSGKDSLGTPKTIVMTQDKLDDPSFIPIDIGGLSNQGYDYLKNKATDKYLAGVYDLMKSGQVPFLTPDQVNKILVDPKYQQLLLDDPDILKQLQRMRAMADDGTKIASTDPSAAFPSAPLPSPDSSMDTNQEGPKPSKAKGADAKLGNWMSRTDFMALYPDSTMVDYLDSLPYQPSDFMTPNPNYPGAWDQNRQGYENYFMNGDLSALGNREGTPKPRNTKSTDIEYTPQELKKGFSANQILNYLKTKFKSPLGPATDIIADVVADTFGQRGSKAILDDYTRNFVPALLSGKNVAGKTSGNPRNVGNLYSNKTLSDYEKIYKDYQKEKRGEKNLEGGYNADGTYQLDLPWTNMYTTLQDANSEIGNTTGTLDPERAGDGFVDNGDGTETLIKRYDFDNLKDMAGSNVASNLGALTYGVISGIPLLLGKGESGRTPSAYIGITFDKKTGKVIKNYKKGIAESLDESVKLGHFEPEALTVDLEKLRKGILPDFPKNPPPKLINGYSEKSKLLPKTVEGEPYIKVDKKELTKNHKLKDSEIKEFMDEINMINDYIKNNPEELIHAMQRYPKHDPRLAQLNWQMDQKLGASEEYMENHFPENKRLFNKIQTKIKQNIDLTDPDKFKNHKEAPKFVQSDISEQERRRQVIARHFNKKKKKKSKQIKTDNLQEANWTPTTGSIANSTSQTFVYDIPNMVTGEPNTFTTSGLGGVESQPSSVEVDTGIDGKFNVNPPSYNQLALAGYAKPILMKRRDPEEVNPKLDASQEFTKKIDAEVSMNARVEDSVDSALLSDIGYKSAEDILAEVGDVWTYEEYMEMMNAIGDRAAAKEDPIVKKILEYSPTGKNPGEVPISLIDAQEAITIAAHKAMDALARAWELYNKIPEPSGYGVDDGDYDLDDNDIFDKLAAKGNVSTSKDMFDYYMDKFMNNPHNKSVNMNRIFKPHLNTLKSYLPRIEQEINLGLNRGDSIDKIQKDVNDYWNDVISPQMPLDLRNSLGNGSQVDVEKFQKTGSWRIDKDFVFTDKDDFTGRDMGWKGLAPQVYARGKSIQKGTGGDLRPYINVPMKYNITIPGSKKKKKKKVNESNTLSKIKKILREKK